MTGTVECIESVRLPGTDIDQAIAVRAGNWIFINGIETVDYGCGLPPEIAGNPALPLHGLPRHRREADHVCARFRDLLARAGTSFANAVRLDQYFLTFKAVDPYHLARRAAFGDYIPPSTSVLMEGLASRGVDICASLLAVMPGAAREPQRVATPQLTAPASSGYVPGVVSGDFIFLAGQMARGADGNPDPRAHVAAHSRWGGYEIRKQTEYLVRQKLLPGLAAAGSSPDRVVKAQVYLTDIEDTPHFLDVWNEHFGARTCALTIVATSGLALVQGAIEVNLIALRRDGTTSREVVDGCIPAEMTFGAAGVRAGDLLLLSGMLAADANGPVQPAATGNFPHYGGAARSQMDAIVAAIGKVCEAAGASIGNVVRIHQFHSDLADFYPMHRAWQKALGDAPVPFTAVGVPSPLPVPGCSVVCDAWVYAP